MSESRFVVEHVCLTADKPFEEVANDLARQLGRFDPEILRLALASRDPQQAKAKINSMAGPGGFMLFGASDHGLLLGVVGRPRKAVQFVVGNPAIALEMTQHDLRAGLYAPLRLLLYQDEQGQTCLEYDKPSSLFGQFANDAITPTATLLNQKLEALTANALAIV
ncbi:MAG TPA: DUF302 domain-containing protein [Planctomycetaceae bacterium]|jgi:uncharacterized protein (DUF302 family)|nr:DUF302 domain-containing protein [Planctomycetaceae bacterium]